MEYVTPNAQIIMLCPAKSVALIEDSDYKAGEGDSVIVSDGDVDIEI
jgi:hypothetical protein